MKRADKDTSVDGDVIVIESEPCGLFLVNEERGFEFDNLGDAEMEDVGN